MGPSAAPLLDRDLLELLRAVGLGGGDRTADPQRAVAASPASLPAFATGGSLARQLEESAMLQAHMQRALDAALQQLAAAPLPAAAPPQPLAPHALQPHNPAPEPAPPAAAPSGAHSAAPSAAVLGAVSGAEPLGAAPAVGAGTAAEEGSAADLAAALVAANAREAALRAQFAAARQRWHAKKAKLQESVASWQYTAWRYADAWKSARRALQVRGWRIGDNSHAVLQGASYL